MSILAQIDEDDLAAYEALAACRACGDLTSPGHRLCATCAEAVAEMAARIARERHHESLLEAAYARREELRWAA